MSFSLGFFVVQNIGTTAASTDLRITLNPYRQMTQTTNGKVHSIRKVRRCYQYEAWNKIKTAGLKLYCFLIELPGRGTRRLGKCEQRKKKKKNPFFSSYSNFIAILAISSFSQFSLVSIPSFHWRKPQSPPRISPLQSLPDLPLHTTPAFPRYPQGHEASTWRMVLPAQDSSPVSSESGTPHFTRRDFSPWNTLLLLGEWKGT